MSTLHSGWHNERISLLGTLGTPQFVVLGLGLLPALFFLQAQAWILFAVALLSWLLLFAVVALPNRLGGVRQVPVVNPAIAARLLSLSVAVGDGLVQLQHLLERVEECGHGGS